jgi:outer membrane protein with beta-barrel domain
MNRTLTILLGLLFLTGAVQAQQSQRDEPKYNFNIGVGFGMPQGRTNDFVDVGANFTIGGGCNIKRWVGVLGEIMYQGLPIQQSVRSQIRVADASSWLFGITGNVMFRTPIKDRFGFYLIGGGGLYRRTSQLSRDSLIPGTICLPGWIWWVDCVDGFVPIDNVLASESDNVFGGNIGGGFTYRVGEGNMKVYTEVRFHYAPTDRVITRVLPITIGVRW